MFKYELIILALAFCALQYGRLQNESTSQSFLQSDRGEEESQGLNEWGEGSEINASSEETTIQGMDKILEVSASLGALIEPNDTSLQEYQI